MEKRFGIAVCLLPLGLLVLDGAAAAVTETVSYSDGRATLSGFIAYPANTTGQLPVVLHVHTWTGLSDFERERARRTADELGLIGFAVSVFTNSESQLAANGSMAVRSGIVHKYQLRPSKFVTRLAAAMTLLRTYTRADASRVAAAGYCFGGMAVLHFAKRGGASDNGLHGVFSFHGSLIKLTGGTTSFGNVTVVVANGAADSQIPMSTGSEVQAYMTNVGAQWEFATYGHAKHGFTRPAEGDAHFHFERMAEARSWESMRDGLRGFGFLNLTSPLHSIVTENVTYNDGGVPLSGFIAYPANATGRLPVILHAHTWSGLSAFERDRARRTASELGYIGFAVSLYTDQQTAQAQASFQARMGIVQGFTPQRFASRLSAAVNYIRGHALANASQLGASGYCFGGTAVLQYARLGKAVADGVSGVASFHGGLSGMDAYPRMYCPTRVAIFNGAGDDTISDSQITSLATALEDSQTHWEFTNYSKAGHGFTHPRDGTAHFNYDQVAERRSWKSMADFFSTTFAGHGRANSSSCQHSYGTTAYGNTTTTVPSMSTACVDDHAGVAQVAGSWGITTCTASFCTGQYATMIRPLCPQTCGSCTTTPPTGPAAPPTPPPPCVDDDAAVARVAGAFGITSCRPMLCTSPYANLARRACPVTCGVCTPDTTTTTSTEAMTATTSTEAMISRAPRAPLGAAVAVGGALFALVAQLLA